MQEIVDFLVKPYQSYQTWEISLEIIAAFLGICSVLGSMLRKIWVYQTGIISTGIYIFLLYRWGLYGDTLINVYYTIMSIYGWILWSRNLVGNTTDHEVKVEYMKPKEWFYGLLLLIGSILLVMTIYYYRPFFESGLDCNKITEAGFNFKLTDYIDAVTTGIFLIGMWTMARRKVENWLFWILGDLISIPLYLIKGYGITSFQYLVFLVLAIIGYFLWKKSVKSQTSSVIQ